MKPRTKFDYVKFGNALNIACVAQVKEQLGSRVPLTHIQIFKIMQALRKFDRKEFAKYIDHMRAYYKLSRYSYQDQVVMVYMDPKMRWLILIAIEAVGGEKEIFEVARLLIRWFGIDRARVKVFKDFIPQDNREGLYDNKEYDGIGRTGFCLDNIGLLPEEENEMRLAVENNKWSKDQLRIC